ncbi:MAG: hypothetical protein LW806_06950 [Planctomycetaceae bacterium]|nr:hypothetical protein [Planctomycetaceae bacterium]
MVLTLLIAVGGVWITRPSTLAWLILPRATKALGGPVTASRIALEGFDTLVLEDLRVRVDGWKDDAGQLAYADRIRVRFSPWALLIGAIDVRSVSANRLELRLVERADGSGNFSILDLKPERKPDEPEKPDERKDTVTLPAVTIGELVVENGVDASTGYRALGELRFRGELRQNSDRPTHYDLLLTGRPDAEGNLAIGAIRGGFSPSAQELSLEVDDLVVKDHELAIAPTAVRDWTRRLSLDGKLRRAKFDYSPTTEPSAELDVEGVAIDLPLDLLGEEGLSTAWSGFAGGKAVPMRSTPRMTVREGSLRVWADRAELRNLKGELGARDPAARVIPVPFECAFTIDIPRESMEPFDWEKRDAWLEQALRIAPFTLSATIPSFSSPVIAPGAPDTLQLPAPAVKIISDFNIVQWTIDVETRFERGTPTKDRKPAPFRSTGTLNLKDCAGAFEEFPYPLEAVTGTITFEGDDIVVERIVGQGRRPKPAADPAKDSTPAGPPIVEAPREEAPITVAIEGRLDGVSTGAEIDLNIICEDAPIDGTLFASFDGGTREALELLFDERAAANLSRAGLLPDANALVAQRQQLARLGDGDATKATRERLGRSIAAGPFALGGRCGFRMRVYSPAGFGQPIIVTGDIEVRKAGVLFGRFPYPLRLERGAVQLLDEAIVFSGGGLSAVTPAGGLFTVSGSVRIPRDGKGGRDLLPLMQISDKDDALNPALLAAIPHSGEEVPSGWPGQQYAPGGELLRALGLSGSMEMNGVVTSKPDGSEDYRFKIAFSEGLAAPDAEGRTWLATQGLEWPAEFTLEECSARIDIVPERVSFDQCVGRHGTGSIVASGFDDLNGPNSLVEVELHDLPVDRAFEGFLAGDSKTAQDRFARYGPTGAIDGSVRRSVGAKGSETRGTFSPDWLEVTLDGSRVRAERIAGRIALDERGLRAESLEFRLTDGNQDDGILRLSGPLSTSATNASSALDARLSNCRFESPLVRELLAPRADAVVDWMRSSNATGRFDAHYARGAKESIEVTPKSLAAGARDARVEILFDETSSIDAGEDGVRWKVAARFAPGSGATAEPAQSLEGGTVRAEGTVEVPTNEGVSATASLVSSLHIDAPRLTRALRAQLPPPLDTSSAAIDLLSEGPFTLAIDEMSARWRSGLDSTSVAGASATGEPTTASNDDAVDVYRLKGEATLSKAGFSSGVAFSALDGRLPFSLDYEPRAPKPVRFESTLHADRAIVFERPMGAAEVRIATDATGDALSIEGAGDFGLGRFDLVAATDFKANTYRARVRLAGADYALVADPKRSPERNVSNRGSDGRLEGYLEISGPMGSKSEHVSGRAGLGRIAVRDARLADAPIALRALQLTQLMLPLSASLNALDTTFRIEGDTVVIDPCTLTTGTLTLSGAGKLDIPTFALAMRFFPKGTVPILSDVIGAVTNQLFAIDIGGTLGEPVSKIVPIPSASAMPTMNPAATTPAPASPQPASPEPASPAPPASEAPATGTSPPATPATAPPDPNAPEPQETPKSPPAPPTTPPAERRQ